MDRCFITTSLIAIAVLNLAYNAGSNEHSNALYAGYENGISIPFELQSGFLVVVSGRVGQRSGLHFILDTGATRSVIDRHLVVSRAPHSKSSEVLSFDQRLDFQRTTVEGLAVGPIHASNSEVEVANLPEYSELAENADGIIGMDLLSAANKILIDYQERTVTFAVHDAEAKPLPHPRCFTITVSIQGIPLRLVVDTGFDGIAIHEDRLRSRLAELRTQGTPIQVRMGRFKTTKLRVCDVSIEGPPETREILLIRGSRENEIDRVDGYLGVAALHADRVELDFATGLLRWEQLRNVSITGNN
jgi:predicted aspartyl protease